MCRWGTDANPRDLSRLQPYVDANLAIADFRPSGYLLAFFACRFSLSVFWAGFFSMLFFVFLSLLAML